MRAISGLQVVVAWTTMVSLAMAVPTYWDMDYTEDRLRQSAEDWQASPQVYQSFATVYTQDGLAGSCGEWHSDEEYVCALSNEWMGGLYQAPLCGEVIEVVNVGSDFGIGGIGNSILVTVRDTCPTCSGDQVDLSVGSWNSLTGGAEPSEVHIKWRFVGDDADDEEAWHYGDSDMREGFPETHLHHEAMQGVWSAAAWNERESDQATVYQWRDDADMDEEGDEDDEDDDEDDEENDEEEHGDFIWSAQEWNAREEDRNPSQYWTQSWVIDQEEDDQDIDGEDEDEGEDEDGY